MHVYALCLVLLMVPVIDRQFEHAINTVMNRSMEQSPLEANSA